MTPRPPRFPFLPAAAPLARPAGPPPWRREGVGAVSPPPPPGRPVGRIYIPLDELLPPEPGSPSRGRCGRHSSPHLGECGRFDPAAVE